MSLPRRQRLHLKVANAIERAAGENAEQYASDLARHLFQAGTAADPAKTVRFLSLAGDLALETAVFDEALRHFDEALSFEDEDDPRHVADLRDKKGQALRSLGRWEEAVEEWKQALSTLEELGDRPVMATVCWELATLLMWSARGTDAVGVARRGLESLGSETSADRCLLLASCGHALGLSAECSDEVIARDEMLSDALAMSEALGDRRAHQTVLLESAYKHFNCMRSPEHAKAALRAAELLRAAGDVWNMADALTTFQVASALAGRLDGVAQLEEETATLARRLGHVGANLQSTWARGMRDWLVAADLD